MDPSSLIFLAIIAIWAAYLVGQWVRRRDQLATARSIDRFSDAMRVLERRTPTRPVTAARPTARAYVVASVRVPPASASRTTGSSRSGTAAHTAPGSRTSSAAADGPATEHAARSGATAAPPGFPRSARPRITREAARRRARLVLGLVVATALAWTLTATTSLAWWPAAVATAALAAVLVQLRRTARPSGSVRRPAHARPGKQRTAPSARRRPAGRSSSGRRGLASRVPAPARRPRHEDARSVLDKVDAARRSQAERVAGSEVVAGAVLPDADQHLTQADPDEASAAESVVEASAEGWQPVPVPPPTYTLKPKARPAVRRQVEAAGSVDEPGDGAAAESHQAAGARGSQRDDVSPPTPREPAPAGPAFDLDEILERRIASGS